MEITVGFLMFAGGIAGSVICLFVLMLTGVIFSKQQRRLLDKLQHEE